jgi:hypothetical protein
MLTLDAAAAQRGGERRNGPGGAGGGTAECTPTGCTFTNYSSGASTINGSITSSGDTYTFDITMTLNVGFNYSLTQSGSVTATDTTLDGDISTSWTIEVDASQMTGGASISGDGQVDVTFDLGLEAGCVASGTMSVNGHSTLSAGSQGGSGSYSLSASATATFAGCGTPPTVTQE